MTAEAFFRELKKLILSQPKNPTHNLNCESCDYGDQLYYCKNMVYSFDCLNSNDCIYLFDSRKCVSSVDCDFTLESELCYECVDAHRSFNSEFLEDSHNMRDSSYSYACRDCHNVFGCVGLQNKSYCIFNRQLTEDEYKEKIQKYKALPTEKVLEMMEELKKRFPKTQTHGFNNENSPYGDYVYNSKNCYMNFDTRSDQDCAYLYDSGGNKNCLDSTFSGDSEISYQLVDSAYIFNCDFVTYSSHCNDCYYVVNCSDSKNCLGCVTLSHKQYCILNRQLTQEEYERISKPLLEELKNKNLGWADLVF
ncbi:hypothetical protein C4577_04540 [Candidatus Parcubacteria bacterium]|nr:MAG: hypothetical protein C4577_04540 [Candidatus Parcubacteria bacterium]